MPPADLAGSIEMFMRMVEGGQGVTFIPKLAIEQLSGAQRTLVRSLALPIPTRRIALITTHTFVRDTMKRLIVESVHKAVPPHMLSMNNTEPRI